MSGFQFIHVESYGLVGAKTRNKKAKHSIRQIVDEAGRAPGSCPHVGNPQEPEVLYGCFPSEIEAIAESWAEQAKDEIGRKYRKDGLILLAGVISLPREREEDFSVFAKESIKFLSKKYGERLKSVVFHNDESHPHLHYYVIPNHGEKFEDIHEGVKASRIAKAEAKLKSEQNQAYNEAMRLFQDEFSQKVGMRFGLTRLGPKRRRLTREAWVAEQKQAEFFSDIKSMAKKGFKRGYRDGLQKAKEQVMQRGTQLGQWFGGLLGGLHGPTSEALEKLETEKKKRRDMEQLLKSDADKRVIKISHELQVSKKKNDSLTAEVELLDKQVSELVATVKLYEPDRVKKLKLDQ